MAKARFSFGHPGTEVGITTTAIATATPIASGPCRSAARLRTVTYLGTARRVRLLSLPLTVQALPVRNKSSLRICIIIARVVTLVHPLRHL